MGGDKSQAWSHWIFHRHPTGMHRSRLPGAAHRPLTGQRVPFAPKTLPGARKCWQNLWALKRRKVVFSLLPTRKGPYEGPFVTFLFPPMWVDDPTFQQGAAPSPPHPSRAGKKKLQVYHEEKSQQQLTTQHTPCTCLTTLARCHKCCAEPWGLKPGLSLGLLTSAPAWGIHSLSRAAFHEHTSS